jgi:hypothetical protein
VSFTAAASNIAANLSRKLPSPGGAFALDGSCPWARVCRRHLHGVASAFPATGADCRNGTAFGACIRFKHRGAAFN